MKNLEKLKSVLCDPDGKCCISGSPEDHDIVDVALANLETEISDLKRQLEMWKQQSNSHYLQVCGLSKDMADLKQQLTESQAREARLREALEYYRVNGHHEQSYNLACSALALPHDDT